MSDALLDAKTYDDPLQLPKMTELLQTMSEAERAELLSKSSYHCNTPLHVMAESNSLNPDFASMLLDAGANINAQSMESHPAYGATPLMRIITYSWRGGDDERKLPIVKLLLSRGADPNIPGGTFDKGTALHTCAWKGEVRLMECLLEHGANPDGVDKKGNTPLMVAVNKLSEQKDGPVKLLIENRAQVNAQNNEGDTALHLCQQRPSGNGAVTIPPKPNFAALLVSAGADANITNNNGTKADGTGGSLLPAAFYQFCGGGCHPNFTKDFAKAIAILNELEAAGDSAEINRFVNFVGDTSFTPLMSAVLNSLHKDPLRNTLVQRLLNARANPNACSEEGESMLYWASLGPGYEVNNAAVLRMLKKAQAGEKVDEVDEWSLRRVSAESTRHVFSPANCVEVGSRISYVGGGRFAGDQEFPDGSTLRIGDTGLVHAVPGANAELGCTFGKLRVSLNCADVRPERHELRRTRGSSPPGTAGYPVSGRGQKGRGRGSPRVLPKSHVMIDIDAVNGLTGEVVAKVRVSGLDIACKLRQQIAKEAGYALESIRLLLEWTPLPDTSTISSTTLRNGGTVQVVRSDAPVAMEWHVVVKGPNAMVDGPVAWSVAPANRWDAVVVGVVPTRSFRIRLVEVQDNRYGSAMFEIGFTSVPAADHRRLPRMAKSTKTSWVVDEFCDLWANGRRIRSEELGPVQTPDGMITRDFNKSWQFLHHFCRGFKAGVVFSCEVSDANKFSLSCGRVCVTWTTSIPGDEELYPLVGLHGSLKKIELLSPA